LHAWPGRFGDLPVRTKFLITLGIPVIGLVLLIGKQVDSSIKRRNVLSYISIQSQNIELLSNALNELQKESALATGHLTGMGITEQRLELQQAHTDEAITALSAPSLELDPDIPAPATFAGLEVLRQRILQGRTSPMEAQTAYRRMKAGVLDGLGRVAKLALDPETKDKLYSHLSLLHAKEALANIRSLLLRAFSGYPFTEVDMGTLNEQLSQYETNIRLFERDASPELMSIYREVFEGPDVNLMRSIMGTLQEKRSLAGVRIEQAEWWEMGAGAMDKLKTVEDRSIVLIKSATDANLRSAQIRLWIVLVSLTGVVSAVAIMAVVIMRGIRDTVNEVTSAASALALGDVSAHVPVNTDDEIGQMARSFNGMIDHIRSLAASAESIGKGNYDTTVDVRGEKDVLGFALTRMKENLKAARLRDGEQNRALQDEKEKLEQANERIQVLIKEIHHRVKNNLQVVASMLRLQSGTIEDERLQHVFDQSQSRVQSMALIHEKLYKGDELSQLDLALYIKELFAELIQMNNVGDSIRYRTSVDPGLAFDLNTMVPLGLVLNELITNSFKHAFRGRDGGVINLAIHRMGPGEFDLVYADDGVGMPLEKLQGENTTLGVSLIESLVEQLNGHMTVEG
jgi:two-component sensor histidine kinase/HAMP domain-containing protein